MKHKSLSIYFRCFLSFLCLITLCYCNSRVEKTYKGSSDLEINDQQPTLIILGNVQDAGSPHIGCQKECCKELFINPDTNRKVVALGLIDPLVKKNFLIEATPDIAQQIRTLQQYTPGKNSEIPDGVFLTHAHIGHYAGLMFLGKEASNASRVSVYAMPRMISYLTTNGPWSQLVTNQNILLKALANQQQISITPNITIIPFVVPHRDEFSETVGYKIIGPTKTALFIPDIDKWSRWTSDIVEEIKQVDYAFIDATFYDAEEINHRDISEIPHPFVVESMELFEALTPAEKKKVWFIHLNHTNPLLNPQSEQSKLALGKGFNIARYKNTFPL